MTNQHCSYRIGIGSVWTVNHCSRTTKLVERDGKLYCWQHDPVFVAKKTKDWRVSLDAKWAAERQAAADKVKAHAFLACKAAAFDRMINLYNDEAFDLEEVKVQWASIIETFLSRQKEQQSNG